MLTYWGVIGPGFLNQVPTVGFRGKFPESPDESQPEKGLQNKPRASPTVDKRVWCLVGHGGMDPYSAIVVPI